jgi:hypothetical protein
MQRREAQKFLFDEGNDFSRVCAGAGVDPSSLRAQLSKIGRRINMEGPRVEQHGCLPFVLGLPLAADIPGRCAVARGPLSKARILE